jgi:hypothetical protein
VDNFSFLFITFSFSNAVNGPLLQRQSNARPLQERSSRLVMLRSEREKAEHATTLKNYFKVVLATVPYRTGEKQ